MEWITGGVISFFGSQIVQGAAYSVLLAFLGWLIKRWSWLRHVRNISLLAYQYAEDNGLLRGAKGPEKFRWFMEKLTIEFEKDFNKKPNPTEIAISVKEMERQVNREIHKVKPEESFQKPVDTRPFTEYIKAKERRENISVSTSGKIINDEEEYSVQ